MTQPVRQCIWCKQIFPFTSEHFNMNRRKGASVKCLECISVKGAGRYVRPAQPSSKTCTSCSITLAATPDNFQTTVMNGVTYLGHCKSCVRKAARDKQSARRNDPKKRIKLLEEKRKYNQSDRGMETKRIRSFVDNNRRRQRVKAVAYEWSLTHWKKCLDIWGHKCVYCNKVTRLTQDHFIPLSNPNTPGTVMWNIVPSCQSCNSSKNNRDPSSWCSRDIYVHIADKLRLIEKTKNDIQHSETSNV